jgi:hypothetical protein
MLLRASVGCLAGLVLALSPIIAGVAHAESGVETYTPAGAKPDPMSSKDMFTLIGKSQRQRSGEVRQERRVVGGDQRQMSA